MFVVLFRRMPLGMRGRLTTRGFNARRRRRRRRRGSAGERKRTGKKHDYRDLFELWSRGKYFPIFYSRPKVESVIEKTLMMQPTAAPSTAQR